MSEFSHIDGNGRVRMVDVTPKASTDRTAVAQGFVSMTVETFRAIRDQQVKKGNVLETARIAGIMAAKKTAELIPMCHPLNITHAQIDFFWDQDEPVIRIESRVRIHHQTGVEMEALTAVSIAALTIYDMCKSFDKQMTISGISLLKKTGGKSGTFIRTTPE
ncbi:MAG: cyclic pyranopterin monophosphate synthase MoaC [Deltaproteobacteria bacterium]|nr:cyclic pyranopterin monophosphate synthase MoaC [Deltaproteobacteria bacterium]